jgi:FkbH-like protein
MHVPVWQLLDNPGDTRILSQRKRIRRELLTSRTDWLDKRVGILGGSTTHDIRDMIELFLLSHAIRPSFYESEYAQYWQDAMFPNAELETFKPDVIFIHTTSRNIERWPELSDSADDVEALIEREFARFSSMWDKLHDAYACPIIQNNFEQPYWRLLGNKDASDPHGRAYIALRLNLLFARYARQHDYFYINDINWLSADYGLSKWSDPFHWHMYKSHPAIPAIPALARSVANIIKSIYGKNKKAFALDLDNTLWGGVIGDDGVEGVAVGQETSMGQVYSEFQSYIKAHRQLGVLLNVISKNDAPNAIAGLEHPEGTLKPDDFILIKANWEPKSRNLIDMGHDLNLLPESFVFVDDNPAEREIIRQQVPGVAIPELETPETYIRAIDRAGYFEVTTLTRDDANRDAMYKDNAARSRQQTLFTDYTQYLRSLEMTAVIRPFEPVYIQRIAQLTNKSNQFNLTTKRYSSQDIESAAADPANITLYGKLQDKFGDNGVVSVVVGRQENTALHIVLWLMSCRVLKRDMEFAMMDELVRLAKTRGVDTLVGYYYPTAKNAMVKEFYGKQGFTKTEEDEDGNAVWRLDIRDGYVNRQDVITVNGGEGHA